MAFLPDHNSAQPATDPNGQQPGAPAVAPTPGAAKPAEQHEPEAHAPAPVDPGEIIKVLNGYASEAENARDSGFNPRTSIWKNNIDRYWGRYDMSKKASWQSKLVLPEIPQYVDRWAAAMREALDASPRFFTVDNQGTLQDLIPHIEKTMDVLLARCSMTPDGHYAGFSSLFEEQMKLGAMMALCASVTWKTDSKGGRVSVDSVDPREVWYDPKGRNLYRRRRYEIDKHNLVSLASQLDEVGLPIYDMGQVTQLSAQIDSILEDNRRRMGGSGSGTNQGRTPIIIDEWLATVILDDGRVAADQSLMIEANGQFLIRGPEANPYWHNQDWIVFTPMVSVPMSAYGRSYMEDWAPTADAFIEMTNLILDAVQTAAMKAYVVQPSMLADPTQLAEGISPNKLFQLDEGQAVADFMKEINLGTLPQEVVTVWQALKAELRDGAKLSELSLGQMPNKSRITAEEISSVSQSGSAMIRTMAKTIEQRWLEIVLNLVWQTALQYMDFMTIADEIGEDTAMMLNQRRGEFKAKKFNFRVRGISGLLDRQAKMQNFLKLAQVISGSPQLMTAFMQETNFQKLLTQLLIWIGIDPTQFEYTPAEKMQQMMQQRLQMMLGGQPGGPPGAGPPPGPSGGAPPGTARQ